MLRMIWTELEDAEGSDQRSVDSASAAAGSKHASDDASVATQLDGDGCSSKQ